MSTRAPKSARPAPRAPGRHARCAVLDAGGLYDLARTAGWPRSQARTAAAVALAESHGRTCAVGDVALQDRTWGPSVCAWQVRSLRAEHGTGRSRDERYNLSSPDRCAASAHAVWRESGWRAWSTFLHRTHLRWLPAVDRALAAR